MNEKLIYARQRAQAAHADTQHAAKWLHPDNGKVVGTVPWVYDLNEAKHLLQQAIKSIDRALELAEQAGNPDLCPECKGTGERVLNPDWPSGTESYSEKCPECGGMGAVASDHPTAAEVMEQEG